MLKLESRKQILLTLESKQKFTLEAKTDFNLLEAKKASPDNVILFILSSFIINTQTFSVAKIP